MNCRRWVWGDDWREPAAQGKRPSSAGCSPAPNCHRSPVLKIPVLQRTLVKLIEAATLAQDTVDMFVRDLMDLDSNARGGGV